MEWDLLMLVIEFLLGLIAGYILGLVLRPPTYRG